MDDSFREIEALDVQYVRPEALGEPGQRRFRIVVVINGSTRISWMEKEQVRRLGELLQDVLTRLPEREAPVEVVSPLISPDESTPFQFRAGRMELSYDEEDDRLIVLVHDIEAEDNPSPALAFRLSRAQSKEFSAEAERLVDAGRQLCPLCGRPMGPGRHVCEKQNGHLQGSE